MTTYLARSVDHLGAIGSALRDLGGFDTLAHELIQNADDARATCMSFRVTNDALIVDNDGVFSDCGSAEALVCPWRLEPKRLHKCDFHRFRSIIAADKREEAGTIGAFGVGFLAVYQITDRPQLISSGKHWIVDETQPEDRRIEQCDGCQQCRSSDLPGTRFLLPWAMDPRSAMRAGIRAQHLTSRDVGVLEGDIKSALTEALLFVRRLKVVEVWHDLTRVTSVQRQMKKTGVTIIADSTVYEWELLEGEFEAEAAALQGQYGEKIERKRSARVAIAVPHHEVSHGKLYAFLPTKHTTGLPFHVQADFFPSSDRKHVLFDRGYQTEWNQAALDAAAVALASSLVRLGQVLGPEQFWNLLQAVHDVALGLRAKQEGQYFRVFWDKAHPSVRREKVVWTISEEWARPDEVLQFSLSEEEYSAEILASLGLNLVHKKLRPYFGLLRSSEVGVQLLDVPDIVNALAIAIPNSPLIKRDWPAALRKPAALTHVWKELEILLARQRSKQEHARMRELVRFCPVVPCRDGTLRTPNDSFWSDSSTIQLFSRTTVVPFATALKDSERILEDFCNPFGVVAALEHLDAAFASGLVVKKHGQTWKEVLSWFAARRFELTEKNTSVERLKSLPLFPSPSDLRPLSELSLPGDFVDPLGIASLVDVAVLGELEGFLRDLGAKELTLAEYVTTHVPRALKAKSTAPSQRLEIVELLSKRLGEIRGHQETLRALANTPIVECDDQQFRMPDVVYFRNDLNCSLLGDSIAWAKIPARNPEAVMELYRWLGVAEEPREKDLLSQLDGVTGDSVSGSAITSIGDLTRYLSQRWNGDLLSDTTVEELQQKEWLPGQKPSEGWYRPCDIYTTFRQYLFSTQAVFLALPRRIQEEASAFLHELGTSTEPPADRVVAHLLSLATAGQPASSDIYRYLNDAVSTVSNEIALRRLRDTPSLYLGPDGYVLPSDVYWGSHPFGSRRQTLAPDLRAYQTLLGFLGVKERPDAFDAISVLQEISAEYSHGNLELPQSEQTIVLACWQLLTQAVESGEVFQVQLVAMRENKVVLGPEQTLNPPSYMFFDDRAGLARRFPRLRYNIIPKTEEAWPAMACAGVRSLAELVRTELLECEELGEDERVLERIRNRRNALARVLATSRGTARTLDELLTDLRCVSVAELVVQYRLKPFGHDELSDPEHQLAHYQEEERTLYLVDSRGDRWAGVARELATALYAEGDAPGAIAAGFKEVLAAETDDEAGDLLDELGFPKIVAPPPQTDAPIPATTLGAESDEDITGSISAGSIGKISSREPETVEGDEPTVTTRTKRKNRQAKLRTYVVSDEASDAIDTRVGGQEAPRGSAIDVAGVSRVMRSESDQGRLPTEMPHTHEGYDIESRDGQGTIVRYIEVKSCGTEWGVRGVGLSKPQFRFGLQHGARYWLYVVERALDESAVIHRIQDPATRVTQYLYDDGWRVLAE